MIPVEFADIEALIALRRDLHAHPELSGKEAETARRIVRFLEGHRPDQLHTEVGGHGVVAVFDSGKPGPAVVLRCELDALPIHEPNELPYRSVHEGISHKCGHDGHMATAAGMAVALRRRGLSRGKVALLFQPAEESGEGARGVLGDERFRAIAPDFIFGFHNLPKFPLRQAVVRAGVFACASVGSIVRFEGSGTHSSYPEHGRSPALAVAELIGVLTGLPRKFPDGDDLTLVTVTQAQVGDLTHKIDFGVAPAAGCVVATLRAERQSRLDSLKTAAREAAEGIAARHGLKAEISWHEEFASTRNSREATAIVREAAEVAGLAVSEVKTPFRWSEDFGLFLENYPGAFFGLGAGEDSPQLHNENYDYPDELIATGLAVYWALVEQVLGQRESPGARV